MSKVKSNLVKLFACVFAVCAAFAIATMPKANVVGAASEPSSFDDKPIKNAMDDYFEWFDDLVNGKEDSKEEKEDEAIEDEEASVSFLI